MPPISLVNMLKCNLNNIELSTPKSYSYTQIKRQVVIVSTKYNMNVVNMHICYGSLRMYLGLDIYKRVYLNGFCVDRLGCIYTTQNYIRTVTYIQYT